RGLIRRVSPTNDPENIGIVEAEFNGTGNEARQRSTSGVVHPVVSWIYHTTLDSGTGSRRGCAAIDIDRGNRTARAVCEIDLKHVATPSTEQMIIGFEVGIESQTPKVLTHVVEVILGSVAQHIFTAGFRI